MAWVLLLKKYSLRSQGNIPGCQPAAVLPFITKVRAYKTGFAAAVIVKALPVFKKNN